MRPIALERINKRKFGGDIQRPKSALNTSININSIGIKTLYQRKLKKRDKSSNLDKAVNISNMQDSAIE